MWGFALTEQTIGYQLLSLKLASFIRLFDYWSDMHVGSYISYEYLLNFLLLISFHFRHSLRCHSCHNNRPVHIIADYTRRDESLQPGSIIHDTHAMQVSFSLSLFLLLLLLLQLQQYWMHLCVCLCVCVHTTIPACLPASFSYRIIIIIIIKHGMLMLIMS